MGVCGGGGVDRHRSELSSSLAGLELAWYKKVCLTSINPTSVCLLLPEKSQ